MRSGPGSGGPALSSKLGIEEDQTLVLMNAPDNILAELPDGVVVRTQARGRAEVVVAFFTRRAKLDQQLDRLSRVVFPAGGLWIAWPKRASGVRTDITDHVVRDLVLRRGLVDNKVCAIDDTWTGLRFVWRREDRSPVRR